MEKTWEIREAELRDAIAKEVDALRLPTRNLQYNGGVLDAVKIIRGTK